MKLRMTAFTTATVLALTPFALANNDDEAQRRIKELERQVEELSKTVKGLQEQQSRTPSTDDLDRAIADLATRIESKAGMLAKGGPNVSAPDVRGIKITFHERFRAEWYGDRTFGAKKNDPILPSSLVTNVSPFSPNGFVLGSFIGGSGAATGSDDATRMVNRARINIDVDVNDKLNAFFQLQHSQVWGTPIGAGAAAGGSLLPNAPITDLIGPVPPGALGEQLQAPASSGALGFRQAYVQFKNVMDSGVDLTLGRFNLELGAGRLLSSAEWDNVGRAFDGAKFNYTGDSISVEAFATKVVQGGLDFQNQDANLLGGSVKISPVKELALTPYTMWLDNNSTGPSAMVGKPWTLGALGEFNVLDSGLSLNGELAIQQDHNRPNTPVPGAKDVNFKEAYMWAVGAELALPIDDAKKYNPVVGFGYQDGSKLFNDMYGTRHGLYGISDVVTSANNLKMWKFYAGMSPVEKMSLRASFYMLRLNEDAGEGVLGQGSQSRNLGNELDLELMHQCSDHVSIGIGYAHFFTGYAMQDGAYSPGAAYATAISKSADTRRDSDTIFASINVTF